MTFPMRIPAILIGATILVCPAHLACSQAVLSPADREALLENLEKLRETAVSKVDARFSMALAAYREAMSSDEAVLNFYLKCVEKVDFEDHQKKAAEFRDWKRKQAEQFLEPGFKTALRCQLRWLILTLRAYSNKADLIKLAPEVQEIVDEIFNNADKLKFEEHLLNQPVNTTEFAKAYDMGDPENKKWPLSPLMLDGVYGEVILPAARASGKLEAVRSAWMKRIKQDEIRFEVWQGGAKKSNQPNAPRSPEYEKFLTEVVPEYQWQMEMDLFRCGDESGAAKRMLDHISKHITHRNARAWGDAFKELLTPKQPASAPSDNGR